MTAPAVEIVAAPDATNGAMVVAAADGLPSNARVQIVERTSTTADVVVQVHWADSERRHARVFVRTRDGRTAERTLAFDAADPANERGRALGFAIAAMIPEDLRAEEKPAPEPQPTPAPLAESPPARAESRDAGVRTPDLRKTLWIDAAMQGGLGIGGSATGLGGALAVRVPFENVALRIGGAIRAGEIGEADASNTLLRADAGIGFFTVAIEPRVTVGARTGFVVLHHALARTDANGVQTSGTHTLFGLEALAEASFALSSRLAVFAAVGSEVAFGRTAVVVGDARVAVLPPVRAVLEVGARVAF